MGDSKYSLALVKTDSMASRFARWCYPALLIVGAGVLTVVDAAATPAAASIKAGEAVYSRCLACHALAYDRTGPHHCGLLGRRAGSVTGFDYSTAMKNSKLVWDEKTLNLFLTNPTKVVPGTAMGYAGISDQQERRDLIAYLKSANDSPACKKQ